MSEDECHQELLERQACALISEPLTNKYMDCLEKALRERKNSRHLNQDGEHGDRYFEAHKGVLTWIYAITDLETRKKLSNKRIEELEDALARKLVD